MSNKLTRKGLAFGGMVGLVATLFAGAPAQASSSGPLTLLPNGGTAAGATYTSLIGAGITLTSTLDFDKQSEAVTAVDSNEDTYTVTPAVDPLAESYYLISNPAGANITIVLGGEVDGEAWYQYAEDGSATEYTADTAGVDFTNGVGSETFVTSLEKIAVKATVGATAGNRSVASIFIDATNPNATSNITVSVTSWADVSTGAASTTGIVNNGELKSATQSVSLLRVTGVSVVTKMDMVNTTREDDEVAATITIGSNVNPYAVEASGDLGVIFFRDGVAMALEDDAATANVVGTSNEIAGDPEYTDIDVNTTTGALSANDYWSSEDGDLTSAVYSARAVFVATSPDIFAGARSVVLDLRNGTNTDVDDIYGTFTESNNLVISSEDSDDAILRSGTKSVTVTGQITDAGDDYASAGVRVRATVTGMELDSTSKLTVTGSTEVIDEADDTITITGFTNANGEFPVTITSNTGLADDWFDVDFEVLLSNGLYESGPTHEIWWEDAYVSDLKVSPSEYLSGANINATFTVVDQWGVGLDSTDDGRVSLKVEAVVDGVVKTATYSETKATTSGAASFSFKNFATAGSNQEIVVYIYEGTTSDEGEYFTIYNNVATGSIAIADVFDTDIEYNDFVTGKLSDPAVLKKATDSGILSQFGEDEGDEYALISGTVLDVNNAGQPGVPVTIAADGTLFYDEALGVLAENSITVYANAQGYFEVKAAVKTVNTTGRKVTVTADGKSATTVLKSYLEEQIVTENLKFSWSLPANFVKNTTYSVALTLTDVWGNPVRTVKLADGENTNAVEVSADGSIQVNGVSDVERNFNSAGVATVFVRSVTDVAGPGSLSAVLADDFNYYTGRSGGDTGLTEGTSDTFVDDVTTSFDESKWSSALSVDVDVLDRAAGKVNVGSFNGKLVVYASDLAGKRISWKVGGNWGSAVATSNYSIFNRPTPRSGVDLVVELYVDGVKQLTKTVRTR